MNDLARLEARLGSLGQRDAPLGARTTYRVGGRASLLVDATTLSELELVAASLAGLDVDVLVVGRGSNLLVSDAGFVGLAIVLSGAFEQIGAPVDQPDGTVHVRVGAAVALPVLARRLADAGLAGLEWAVGVPGSVGGAVTMNAGGHGDEVAGSLVAAELVALSTASRHTRPAAALELSYRRSSVRRDDVVTFATFALHHGDPTASKRAVADVVRWRREHQPGGSNAGSIFANPPGDHAGRLVEAVGAKGRRHGTASVSTKHANFIQADANGSADDVAALIEEVRRTVYDETGVSLRTEVVLVGFPEHR